MNERRGSRLDANLGRQRSGSILKGTTQGPGTSGKQKVESKDLSLAMKQEIQKQEEWKKKARESFIASDSDSDEENKAQLKDQSDKRRRTRRQSSSFTKDNNDENIDSPVGKPRRPSIGGGDVAGSGRNRTVSSTGASSEAGNDGRKSEEKVNKNEEDIDENSDEEYDDETEDDTDSTSSEVDEQVQEAASSFRNMLFKSEEVKDVIKTHFAMDESKKKIRTQTYDSKSLFPSWMLNDPAWTNSNADTTGVHISQIFQKSVVQRTSDESSTLVKWLMSVWDIAEKMGFKRCSEMAKSFKYIAYQEGDDILVEGERGLTFYIIVSGTVAVIKNGIGKVAALGMGKSFGEIALLEGDKEGKDVRTATIRAETKVEIINLHKLDYDRFVKEIQALEKRENFQAFRDCKLFKTWSRSRVEKVALSAVRKNFAAGDYVFRQGTEPNSLYIILEGTVQVIKEILIVNRNKWPTSLNEWSGVAKKTVSSFLQTELGAGEYFGETGIMHNLPRNASILAKTQVLALCLGRDEFLHLLGPNSFMDVDKDDENPLKLLNDVIDRVNGGPSSTVSYGGHTFRPKASKEIQEKEKAIVEKEAKVARMKQRKKLAKMFDQRAGGTFNSDASIGTAESSGAVKKVSSKKRGKSSREQKFGERFYKDVTRKEEQMEKFVGIGQEAVKLSKARKEFLARVQINQKSKVPAADVSIHEIVGQYKMRNQNHKSHSRSLSFSDLYCKDKSDDPNDATLPRAKTTEGSLMRDKVEYKDDLVGEEIGPESAPSATTLPDVNNKYSEQRCHTSGDTTGQRSVIFSPIDRDLRINKGLRLGRDSDDYRPLSAAVSHRLINSTTGRIVHDKMVSNLSDYDERKVFVD